MNGSTRLVAAQAISPNLVRLTFTGANSPMEPESISVAPLLAPGMPVRAHHVVVDGTQAVVYLHTAMTPKVPYELAIPGLGQIYFYGFCPNWPEGRQFDLWAMLPKWNRAIDSSGDLARFISCLQEITDYLLVGIDAFTDIFDLERAPENYLDLILRDLGNLFPFDLDDLDKRRLASTLVTIYRQKGTVIGIRNAIRFFLGIEIEDITAYNVERLILGESELGMDWVVGPSDRFALFAFEIRVGRKLSTEERERMTTIVNYLLPVGAHIMGIVEPLDPPVWDYWELGISELSIATTLYSIIIL